MNPSDLLGWLAASLMLLTFSCQDARWLRSLAIAANLAFIAYGIGADLHPIAALHFVLLPINVYRLIGALKEASRAKARRQGDDEPVVRPQKTACGTSDSIIRTMLDCTFS